MLTDGIKRELKMLERHLTVLKGVIKSEPVGIMKLSEDIGMPPYRVRYSLRVLERAGLIRPSLHGATTTEETKIFMGELDEDLDRIIEGVKRMKGKVIKDR
jgi:predicted transcriptional regulator